ncbi:protein lethal(2)essential for life [Microplitis demolitor]|uniref:protein lethal(2)essential for life n=1 Tax=Microplitis demolitor TaxID=69319 RepID=UPI0004CCCDC8|nr:protein lethal(2)essential for life [Microplitis demolitor]
MALVPSNYWRDWWEDVERPHRWLDQHFDLTIRRDSLVKPLTTPYFRDYFRPWRNLLDEVSTDLGKIESDSDKFRITVDVQQFSPHEIIVKTVGNSIIVKAEHEEKRDSREFISKKFMRRYDLPKGHDITRVMSSLSTDGVLTITAPKFSAPIRGERIVPINRTYFPSIKF